MSGENQIEALSPNNDHQEVGATGQEIDSSDSQATYDSESDFEDKIKRLLHTRQLEDPTQGTKRIEHKKKPSSPWTKEAAFLPQPPKSGKKRGTTTST